MERIIVAIIIALYTNGKLLFSNNNLYACISRWLRHDMIVDVNLFLIQTDDTGFDDNDEEEKSKYRIYLIKRPWKWVGGGGVIRG